MMSTLGQVYHLVGAQEIAEMLGISRQRLTQLASRADFPEPVAELAQGRVWETAAIREWARKTGRLADEDDKPEP
jgi:predicted DNA-binding transcriptional regulator AlpA